MSGNVSRVVCIRGNVYSMKTKTQENCAGISKNLAFPYHSPPLGLGLVAQSVHCPSLVNVLDPHPNPSTRT